MWGSSGLLHEAWTMPPTASGFKIFHGALEERR